MVVQHLFHYDYCSDKIVDHKIRITHDLRHYSSIFLSFYIVVDVCDIHRITKCDYACMNIMQVVHQQSVTLALFALDLLSVNSGFVTIK